jgi:hypothetical protein
MFISAEAQQPAVQQSVGTAGSILRVRAGAQAEARTVMHKELSAWSKGTNCKITGRRFLQGVAESEPEGIREEKIRIVYTDCRHLAVRIKFTLRDKLTVLSI